jgi:hypothetical protein
VSVGYMIKEVRLKYKSNVFQNPRYKTLWKK